MKKVDCIVVTRDDLKPAFAGVDYRQVNPYHFESKIIKKFDKVKIAIFVNSTANQSTPDLRSRVLKNDFGLWGYIIPYSKL